jgi:membrane protein YqaA with SNARE-associated domain
MQKEEETKSSFLLKNLARGLAWFAVIITAYILASGELSVYQEEIKNLSSNFVLIFTVFTVSEIVFGIVPPEIFMLIWQTQGVMSAYIINLAILTVISYGAGVLGYYIGTTFSKTRLYRRFHVQYLHRYDRQLKRYGVYLVLVGAITPVPFSAMCMLAGSVNLNLKNFLLISLSRVARFAAYGWMVWKFPLWFT